MTTSVHQLPQQVMRHGDAADLISLLELHERFKLDVVMPLHQLRSELGLLRFDNVPAQLSELGVTDVNGAYRFTDQSDKQLSQMLDIPLRYWKRCRDQAAFLFDDNFNHWANETAERDADGKVIASKKVLVRAMYGQDPDFPGTNGIVRAVVSDRYGLRDNYDTAIALIDGMRQAGLDADNILDARLSENRMYLYVSAPEISVLAPDLLGDYVSPFTGQRGADLPIVEAGIVAKNSETGWGATVFEPRLRFRVCNNGATITRSGEGIRAVHRGAKLDEGQINWSAETRDAVNRVVTNQMRDVIGHWLTKDFVQAKVDELTEAGQVELTSPQETIEVVAKEMTWTEAETKVILGDFFKGRQMRTAGILNAVTSAAQRVTNVDRAQELEETAIPAMAIAARHQQSLSTSVTVI